MEHRPALVFAGGVALLTLAGSLAIGATEGLLGFGNPKQPERAGTLAQSLLDGSGVPAIGPRDTTAANTVWAAGRPVALVTAMAPAQAMNALTAGPGLVGPLLPALQLQLGGGQPALLGAPADAFGPPGSMSPGQPAPWPGASLMGPTLHRRRPRTRARPSRPRPLGPARLRVDCRCRASSRHSRPARCSRRRRAWRRVPRQGRVAPRPPPLRRRATRPTPQAAPARRRRRPHRRPPRRRRLTRLRRPLRPPRRRSCLSCPR